MMRSFRSPVSACPVKREPSLSVREIVPPEGCLRVRRENPCYISKVAANGGILSIGIQVARKGEGCTICGCHRDGALVVGEKMALYRAPFSVGYRKGAPIA